MVEKMHILIQPNIGQYLPHSTICKKEKKKKKKEDMIQRWIPQEFEYQ